MNLPKLLIALSLIGICLSCINNSNNNCQAPSVYQEIGLPMIYGTQRSYNSYCAPQYNNHHLYIGRYGKNTPQINGKGTYTIWQYTESAIVNGIPKPVDMCRFNPKYSIKDIMLPK